MDTLSTIKQPIDSEFKIFKEYYQKQFSSSIPLLNEALVHVSGSSGKMMRPMLVLLVAKSVGAINASTYAAATALELLHCASLLHDDVVDESDMRRGAPSLNSLYNNRVAILSGDYIFSTSLRNAAQTGNVGIIDRLSRLGQMLSSGEMMQLELQYNFGYNEERYYEVIRSKTAALFASCAVFGALSVGADSATTSLFEQFGELLGICFQIKDDIFDYYDNNVGKPTGSDMREGKITLPALYVLAHSSRDEIKMIKEKLDNKKYLDEEDINRLIELSKSEGGVEYAKQKIEEYRSKALSLLNLDIPHDCRKALETYLDYVVNREK